MHTYNMTYSDIVCIYIYTHNKHVYIHIHIYIYIYIYDNIFMIDSDIM